MLRNIKIGAKLTAGFLAVAIAVGISGLIGIVSVDTVGKSADVIYEDEYPIVETSLRMDNALQKQLQALHACLMGEREAKGEFMSASSEFAKQTDALKKEKLTDVQRGSLTEIGQEHREFDAQALEAMTAKDAVGQALNDSADTMEGMDRAFEGFTKTLVDTDVSAERITTAWKEIMPPHDYIIHQGAPEEKASFSKVRAEIEAWPEYESVKAEHDALVTEIDKVFAAYDRYLAATANMNAGMEQCDVLTTALVLKVGEFEEEANRQMAGAMSTADATERKSRITLIWVAALAFVLAIICGLLLSRSITEPLKTAVVVAGRVASGDVTVEMPSEERGDEVGVLVQAFGRMVGFLREMASLPRAT